MKKRGWERTDSMNNLMNHNLTKLKLLTMLTMTMITTDILGEHIDTLSLRPDAVVSILIIIIQRANSAALTDASVALGAGTVVLPSEVERLEEEQDWYLDNSEQDEEDLKVLLESAVTEEWLLDGAWLKEHVDEHVQ